MRNASLVKKLMEIQHELKCEKAQFNKFGGFNYRSKEDILEAVKPLAYAQGCAVVVSDSIQEHGGRLYVAAEASLVDSETGEAVTAYGYSREAEERKGMDASQVTGTAASYAGKRALGNLFAIDDTKDADSIEPKQKPVPNHEFVGRCTTCGKTYTFPAGMTDEQFRSTPCGCARPAWVVC